MKVCAATMMAVRTSFETPVPSGSCEREREREKRSERYAGGGRGVAQQTASKAGGAHGAYGVLDDAVNHGLGQLWGEREEREKREEKRGEKRERERERRMERHGILGL